ncbi:MAG: DUF2794 domain-containing protein [Pseudomonadota bacterium]|nr:DUF2794 domain-containing protein [Pseudomonadota bacterium]|tara:strand:+ start:264 stop:611 length:348 start_codon:yes stop_codon:yes gene_type:complete
MKKIRLIVNNDFNKKEKEIFFIKTELQCILNLYAKMVSNGSWKDYSFSSGNKEVSFNVYQRASEKPVLKIAKNLKPNYYNEKFFIKDKDGNVIKKSENLNQLINKTSWNKLRVVK